MTGSFRDLAVGAAVFLSLLGGAWLGSVLRRRVPDHMLDNEAKEVVRLGDINELFAIGNAEFRQRIPVCLLSAMENELREITTQ